MTVIQNIEAGPGMYEEIERYYHDNDECSPKTEWQKDVDLADLPADTECNYCGEIIKE